MPAYALRSGEPIPVTLENTQIESRITLRIEGTKAEITTHEKTGMGLLPYFAPKEKVANDSMLLRITDGYITLQLPEATYGFAHQPYGRLNSRRQENLLLPYPVNETCTYTIDIPQNMQLRTPETEQTAGNGVGEVTLLVKKEGQRATVIRRITLKKQLYTPAEYADLRRLLTLWSDPNRKTLLFSVN